MYLLTLKIPGMKKLFHAALFLAVMVLCPVFHLEAQEAGQTDQLYYCWEETVKPEFIQDYLTFYRELIGICREVSYPFPIVTWEARHMVFQFWSPLNSLSEIGTIPGAWGGVIERFGMEKYQSLQNTILYKYAKTATVLSDLTYLPDDPNTFLEERDYCRWIEMYLKPGTDTDFLEAMQWFNVQRSESQVQQYLNVARGDLGFEQPDYIVTYYDVSQEILDLSFQVATEEFSKSYQEFLTRIRKLFRKPPEVLNLYRINELTYFPSGS